ncbi:PD40 domain-containing protein [Actinokineospora xionganensis]|uniref:PD40 domain-containing protein n=1 Tax=Actinokineospora xionganensis TaxID=2684470 RepID=A0ABR7KZ90_9PSEU|nr:PD40 domain-containing protein [Actinokineospora xionganensis]MBC6445751.1 PD40 domain-containing protein [Actinokineospora xionganensis]
MIDRPKLIGAALIVTTLLAGAAYLGWRASTAHTADGDRLDLGRAGSLVYIEDGTVRQAVGERPLGVGPSCQRAHTAGGVLACLRPAAIPGGFEVAVFDTGLTERKVIPVWGTPSRTRVSASGRWVAWTVFRSGDSYLADGGFSTTAGAYDLRTGEHHGSLEDYTSIVDGKVYEAADRNFWGITFAADDRTFYATMSSGGTTRLMRGDLRTRRMEALRENVECPSLSADGRRIAYKFRTGQTWRLHVLDLATGADVALAEPDHVDDQPAWLDDTTIAYVRPADGRPTLFAVPADGTGGPRLLRPGSSPATITQD